MKQLVLIQGFVLLLFASLSCKKSNEEPISFSYEKSAGIWVPYQIVKTDGSIETGPFTSSLFGVYAESVQFNKDKTYIPVIWQSTTNFVLKQTEMGTYRYSPFGQRLILKGPLWDAEYEIRKFSEEELWLYSGVTYKLRKQ